MFTLLTVLIVITSVLLVLVVLAQNSKGGGLAAGFTGGSQMMGVKRTTDFIEKLTWGLSIALVVFCLGASMALNSRGGADNASMLQEQAEGAKTAQPRQMQQQPAGQPGQARPAQAPAQAAPQPKK